MADFRKSLLLAAMTLAVGVGTASAQAPTCTGTTGAVPTLRSEGQAELTGAIVLTCANITIGVPANFDVSLNNGTVPITSRVTSGTEASFEAEVTISDPTAPGGLANYFATLVSTNGGAFFNTARFTGVAINTATPQISFTGIRANTNPSYVPLNTGGFGQVLTVISVTNAVLPIQQVNGGFFVGIVLPGLAPLQLTGISFSSCTGSATATGSSFTVGIPENFPTAFKAQGPVVSGVGGPLQDSETGTIGGAPVANSGTQFAVTFASLPTGLTFYVPVTITSTGGGLATVVSAEGSTTTVTGAAVSGLPAGTGTPLLYLAVAPGTTFYYNVVGSNPSVQEVFNLPVYPVGTVSGTTGQPTVSIVLAPKASDLATNVPRFIPLTTTNSNLPITVTTCQTTLLLPYVTNQAGFDTGFSIAATSTDPFGTAPQSGTCTMNMYGANPPAAAPVITVPAGGEGHATVSSVAPNFQGYVIAVCDFQYAHGYVFLSNGFAGIGNGGLSEGYVMNVLSNTRVDVNGNPASTAVNTYGTGTGEILGH